MYCSVWLIPRYGTPSSSSAAIIGALKCSAQFGCSLPAGAGTEESGLPMCSSHAGSIPAGTRRKRS